MTNELTPSTPAGPPVQKVVKNWDRRRKIVALTVVPALLIASLIVSIPAVFFISDPLNIPIQIAVGITIVAEIIALIWAYFFAGLRPPKKFLFLGLKRWWYIPLGIAVGLLSYAVLQGIGLAAGAITGESIGNSDTSNSLMSLTGVGGALFLILVVGILGPTLEEFYFRGVVLGSLQNSSWNKPWLSIVLSGVFFGIMHLQGFDNLTSIMIFVWITIMGGIFAALVLWTKSLWTAVAAHISYNMVTSVIIILGIGA